MTLGQVAEKGLVVDIGGFKFAWDRQPHEPEQRHEFEVDMDEEKIPLTLDEAVDQIVGDLTEEDIEFIKSEPESVSVHYFAGRQVRNKWDLWNPDAPLTQHFQETYDLGHADDMSGIIMEMVWRRVRHGFYTAAEVEAEAARYRRHWWSLGIDPKTQKKLSAAQ